MPTKPDNPPTEAIPVEDLSYEQALAELEEIVASLEAEERSLQAGLALYERGQALARHCANLLDLAELKVQELGSDDLADVAP